MSGSGAETKGGKVLELHAGEDAPGAARTSVARGAENEPGTPVQGAKVHGRVLAECRVKGRAHASSILRDVFEEARQAAKRDDSPLLLTHESVARSLVVTRPTIEKWASIEDDSAMALGDVMAARGDFAEAVLLRALEVVRQRRAGAKVNIESAIRRVNAAIGSANAVADEALADADLDPGEAKTLLSRIDNAASALDTFRRIVVDHTKGGAA